MPETAELCSGRWSLPHHQLGYLFHAQFSTSPGRCVGKGGRLGWLGRGEPSQAWAPGPGPLSTGPAVKAWLPSSTSCETGPWPGAQQLLVGAGQAAWRRQDPSAAAAPGARPAPARPREAAPRRPPLPPRPAPRPPLPHFPQEMINSDRGAFPWQRARAAGRARTLAHAPAPGACPLQSYPRHRLVRTCGLTHWCTSPAGPT